ADTWIEMMIAKNLHEIVFAETLGSPFQAICTTKKVYNDKCKLIHFEHDSKNKMLGELIEKKCTYLSDWKNLCNNIHKSEFNVSKHIYLNILEAKLKILILDCPAHPFCQFVLSDVIHNYEEIGETLLRDYNKVAGSGPYEVDCGIRGYQSHPSPQDMEEDYKVMGPVVTLMSQQSGQTVVNKKDPKMHCQNFSIIAKIWAKDIPAVNKSYSNILQF
ncbi:33244_t:CDS:2, partial [Gigaspora margarita]